MNMLERFKAIFVSPSRLFSEIKEEADYKPTLMYYLVFILGLSIVSFVISLIGGRTVIMQVIGGTAVIMIQNAIIGWVTSIISVLVFAFFIGWVASWFGGNRSWIQGLKVAVYSGTIFAVFGLIMAIISLIMPLPDLTNPQAILANIGAIAGVAIVGFLATLGVFIWTIVIYVKGIAISHDISGGKAFGTLIIAAIFNAIVIGIWSWILGKIGLVKTIVPIA